MPHQDKTASTHAPGHDAPGTHGYTGPTVDGTKLDTVAIQYAAYRLGTTVLTPITNPPVPAANEEAAFVGDGSWQYPSTFAAYVPPPDMHAAIDAYLEYKAGKGKKRG